MIGMLMLIEVYTYRHCGCGAEKEKHLHTEDGNTSPTRWTESLIKNMGATNAYGTIKYVSGAQKLRKTAEVLVICLLTKILSLFECRTMMTPRI